MWFCHSSGSKNHSGYIIHQHLFKPLCFHRNTYALNHPDAWLKKKTPPNGFKTPTHVFFCCLKHWNENSLALVHLQTWSRKPRLVASSNHPHCFQVTEANFIAPMHLDAWYVDPWKQQTRSKCNESCQKFHLFGSTCWIVLNSWNFLHGFSLGKGLMV